MSGVAGETFEQEDRLALWRELDALLDGGFAGQITLHCQGNGTVSKFETRQINDRRRTRDRRQQARPEDEGRRKG